VDINNGIVGDATWIADHIATKTTGIQPGFVDDDFNVTFPTNAPPTGTFLSPSVILGTNWLGNGTYTMSSLDINTATKPMIVTGKATLYVVDDFKVTQTGYIEIRTNASLTVYVGGKNGVITAPIVNLTGQPANFNYIGLPTNKSLKMAGEGAFIGTINAPQAELSISGNGGIYGAAIVNTYSSSGNASVHYDECLNLFGKFRVKAWKEL
jgi:hypothetical protein